MISKNFDSFNTKFMLWPLQLFQKENKSFINLSQNGDFLSFPSVFSFPKKKKKSTENQ